MNFRLFLFLVYVLPGRSREDIVSRFPKKSRNNMIYDVRSDFVYQENGVFRLNSAGEKKLYSYFAKIGGFLAFLCTVAGVLIA